MTDHQRVYTEVVRTLKDLMRTQKQGHVVTLAMMITGIVMSEVDARVGFECINKSHIGANVLGMSCRLQEGQRL